MDTKTAKDYASDGLLWLTRNQRYLEAFLVSSGTTVKSLRSRSDDTEFLSFVLDFFMTSDELILNLCRDLDIEPENIQRARHALSNKDLSDWT